MNFHEFSTWWDAMKSLAPRGIGRKQAYADGLRAVQTDKALAKTDPPAILENESKWYDNDRPYYKAYPCIVQALCKLKLDFNCPCPEVPEGAVSVRFAKGNEPTARDGNKIAALLVHKVSGCGEDRLFIQVSILNNPDRYWFYFDTNHPSMTIQDLMDSRESKYKEVQSLATRICLTVLMIQDDSDIITPDVLNEHQSRYDKETDEAWKNNARGKAKNKGVFGWSLGKHIEVAPHFRRPHWAVRWFGKGGTIPKVVPVKGCKVRKIVLTSVPNGHMLEDGTEVETATAAATD